MRKKKNSKNLSPELKGFLLLSSTIFLLLSLAALGGFWHGLPFGEVGRFIAFYIAALFGIGSYLSLLFAGWIGWRLLIKKPVPHLLKKSLFFFIFFAAFSLLLSVLEMESPSFRNAMGKLFFHTLWLEKRFLHLGGAIFFYLYRDLPAFGLSRTLSALGTILLSLVAIFMSGCYFYGTSPKIVFLNILHNLRTLISYFSKSPSTSVKKISLPTEEKAIAFQGLAQPKTEKKEVLYEERPLLEKRNVSSSYPSFPEYTPPDIALLTTSKKVDPSSLKRELTEQARILEETLLSFGIEAKVGQVNVGPTITSFEVHPAIGVKVQKIKTLENDIALNLQAKSIRILAPIPGKAAIGIEIPSLIQEEVGFKELVQAYRDSGRHFEIPLLLGKAVNGDLVMGDLTKMPHCLIAGATGSGKSVCINIIILSILFHLKPEEARLMLVDPKKVELTPYSHLPHMLAPVITEAASAVHALKYLVKEMERRYERLKEVGAKNISGFNTLDVNEKMPYIIAIFDELADLMMVSGAEVETPIARIAQMARAVGIHLILATQRPSREVITGLIKANFPTRISFKMASRINSQIVLDDIGAESLLGNGDMLFQSPGLPHLIRAQGAFIRDADIAKIIDSISKQAAPQYIISSFDHVNTEHCLNEESEDPLYKEAKQLVIATGNASTTFLQRKLKIGYARAASLIDELEAHGIVSAGEGTKPRRVLTARPSLEEVGDDI